MGSIANDILQAVVGVIQSLGLQGLTSAKIVVKDLPRVADGILPQPPCIIVSPSSEPEEYTTAGFENEADVDYPVNIVIVTSSNRNLGATLLPEIQTWREQIRRAFGRETLGPVPTVWKTKIVNNPVLDRSALPNQFNYSPLGVVFTSREAHE